MISGSNVFEIPTAGCGSQVERGKGKEEYNLATDEDCRAEEARQALEPRQGQGQGQGQDMPTWTFCERSNDPGPQEDEEVHSSKM